MATSAGLVPEIAWPLTILSAEAPMFTGFAGWVDPEKYTAELKLPGRNDVRAEAPGVSFCVLPRGSAVALRISSMLLTPWRCAMGASSAAVTFFPSRPPAA
jgi:hypothetical protein